MYVYFVGIGYMHLGQQVHYHTIISEFGVCCQTCLDTCLWVNGWRGACVILYAVYWVEREASNGIEVALNIAYAMWLVTLETDGQVPR